MATAGVRYGFGAGIAFVLAGAASNALAAVPATPLSLAAVESAPASGNSTFAPASTHVTNNLGTFNIAIVPGAGLAANRPALAAFNAAAQQWASRISDPITITINADLSTSDPLGNTFGPFTIGSTSAVTLQGGYSVVRDAMVADAAAQPAALNNQIIASLPTAAQFTATLPAGRSLDGTLLLSKANAKALNFSGLDDAFGTSDGTIAFNSAFSFDYDNADGVAAGTMDFQTVAAHEIGHLLGFTSSVDDIDATTAATYPSIAPTTLDLFRFGRLSGNPSTVAEFTSFSRNLVPGADAILDDVTSEYQFSTGLSADGRQASHWKDDELIGNFIGIMDPTLSYGTTEWVQDSDLRALDLIGYDVQAVPEPVALSILALGVLAMSTRQPRRGGRM
jgi:hypothetical protein